MPNEPQSFSMTALQKAVRDLAVANGVTADFMDASNHNYRCRCDSCLQWWVKVGAEDTGNGWGFGPFTLEEYLAAGGEDPGLYGEV